MGSNSHFAVVGQVSGLPVCGGSASARGRRPLQLADPEVCPTTVTKMNCWPIGFVPCFLSLGFRKSSHACISILL